MVIRYNDEIRKNYLNKLPLDLGLVFVPLLEEVITLSSKWAEFKKLFAKSNERIELLNKTAPSFFHMIQNVLVEDIILHLARLSDYPKTAGKENLTIQRLPSIDSIKNCLPEIEKTIDDFVKSEEFALIKDWRNRILAHTDFKLATEGVIAKQLEVANKKKIENTLKLIQDILRKILLHFINEETIFEPISQGDADALIFYLNSSIQYLEKRKQRILEGEPLPDDLIPPSTI
jgi:hypothetical protein